MTDLPPYVIKGQWVDPDPPWTGPRSHPYPWDEAYVVVVTLNGEQQQWIFPTKHAADEWASERRVVHDFRSLPDTLDVDEDGYPSEERLEEIKRGYSIGPDGARWLVEVFPKLAESLAPYAHCTLEEGINLRAKLIHFSTGGWSGCEDFIEAVLENRMLNILYYTAWRRGGHFTFTVPESALEESAPKVDACPEEKQ